MAESSTGKSKAFEIQTQTKQSENQTSSIGKQGASGASAGAGAPPLDKDALTRIQRSPQNALRSDMLALQRTVGNRAVAALVRGDASDVAVQAKLEVGPVNDTYEQEADRVARVVTSSIAQRKPSANVKSRDDDSEEGVLPAAGADISIKRMVQRSAGEIPSGVRADGSFAANSKIQARIRQMEGGGRPLSDSVRRQLEPGFGSDLSSVRVHTGGDAVQLSRDIGARAFTHGSHIAFASGEYNPNSQAGRHLLAHELTHTIQQTGAHPLPAVQRVPKVAARRGPKSVIQRLGVWEKMKSWWNRSKEVEVPQLPENETVEGTPTDIQGRAETISQKAIGDAISLVSTAKTNADAKMTAKGATPEMVSARKQLGGEEVLGGLLTIGAKGGAYGGGAGALKRMESGDDAQKKFLEKFKTDMDELQRKVQSNHIQVMNAKDSVAGPLRSGTSNVKNEQRKKIATQSFAYAKESETLVESIRKQAEEMSHKAEIERAVSVTDIGSRGLTSEARSLPAAEKSASDSVLSLNRIEDKVKGHLFYIQADLEVLKGYVAAKEEGLSGHVTKRAMLSGIDRAGEEGMQRPLNPDQSFALVGGAQAMESEDDSEEESEKQKQLEETQEEVGKLERREARIKNPNPESSTAKRLHKKKTSLEGKEKAFAKRVRDLEVTHMLYARAQKRLPVVQKAFSDVMLLRTKGVAIYDEIDVMRANNKKPSQEVTDSAILKAAKAHELVAQGVVHAATTYKLKTEVYNESQKSRYKHVGPRAMSKTKRRLKRLAALGGGIGTRLVTGGMLGMQAEDLSGGYRVNIQKRTILDDIERKSLEAQSVLFGVDDKHVRGLGGSDGTIAYVFFKIFSYLTQIIRDIFASLSLWVTVITAGAGSPVGAVFASIALLATLVKGIVDLLLFIWSGSGLINTNDPRSRAILRSENRTQMISVGEALLTGGVAGMTMGMTGDTGMLRGGTDTIKPFGGNEIANTTVGPSMKIGGNLGQNILANNLSNYNTEAGIHDRNMRHMLMLRKLKPAMRSLGRPVGASFNKLDQLVAKKKSLQKTKLVTIAPRMKKIMDVMDQRLQGIPERQGGGQGSSEPPPTPPPMPPQVMESPDPEPIEPGGPPTTSPIMESLTDDDESSEGSEE